MTKLAKGVLSFNIAGAIRLARFGMDDAARRLADAYRQIDPFGGRVSDDCARDLARIPEVPLTAVVRGMPVVRADASYQTADGAMPWEDVMAVLAVAVDRDPKVLLEVGTFNGYTTKLLAMNLPSAAIHTVDLAEDFDASADGSPLPKSDFHLIAARRVGREYRSDPSITNVIQHFGDTSVWDFGKAEGATFFVIDASHTYEYVRNDTEKAMAAARGRGAVTFLWHDCAQWHPDVVRWIAEMATAGHPVKRIAGTNLAIMDASL